MPRIRTIKPEFAQHRKIGRLSIPARWLWVVMLTQADDEGRLVADPGQLRVTAFAYDLDIDDVKVTAWLAEIAASGLIGCYSARGVPYAHFPSWSDHQRIDHPGKSKLPEPPAPVAELEPKVRRKRKPRVTVASVTPEGSGSVDGEPQHSETLPSTNARDDSRGLATIPGGSDQGSEGIKDQGSEGIKEEAPRALRASRLPVLHDDHDSHPDPDQQARKGTARSQTDFERFWVTYPKRASLGRGTKNDAQEVWDRLRPTQAETDAMCLLIQREAAAVDPHPRFYEDTGEVRVTPAEWLEYWAQATQEGLADPLELVE